MSHLSQEEINKLWNEQTPLLSQDLSAIQNLKDAFTLNDKSMRCIDEGTPGGLHCAGSGILLSEATAIEEFKKAGVDGIYSHEECGAAGLYAKANDLDPSKSDEYGIAFAKHIAEKIGVPYKGHITIDKMARPSGLHTARVAYYDGTGNFDPSKVKSLPKGFVIDRKNHSKEYALKEIGVSISIALGSHGFGEKFTQQEPFTLIAIGEPMDVNFSVEALKKELEGLPEQNSGRVKIDGLTAPSL
jgi:hypothetical protein